MGINHHVLPRTVKIAGVEEAPGGVTGQGGWASVWRWIDIGVSMALRLQSQATCTGARITRVGEMATVWIRLGK